MVDNNSIRSKNPEKKSSPFKRILNNMKSFMKKNEEVNTPPSFEAFKSEKNPDSNIPKSETRKKREAKRSKREIRANKNEQKLPAKFKKGW